MRGQAIRRAATIRLSASAQVSLTWSAAVTHSTADSPGKIITLEAAIHFLALLPGSTILRATIRSSVEAQVLQIRRVHVMLSSEETRAILIRPETIIPRSGSTPGRAIQPGAATPSSAPAPDLPTRLATI